MKLRHFAVFGGIFTVIICLLLFLFIVTADDEENSTSYFDFSGLNLSEEVLKHQPTVEKYAKEYGISDYVNYLLAIMQVESGGTATDVMQSSESMGFDCSGLTSWCYGKAGISLPRTAQAQYDATQHIPLSQAKAGDLVFFHSTYNSGTYVTHVGIYAGNNRMYHAGDPIGYADLTSPYWQKHLIGAGRVKSK